MVDGWDQRATQFTRMNSPGSHERSGRVLLLEARIAEARIVNALTIRLFAPTLRVP
jgi:hypothetical protein